MLEKWTAIPNPERFSGTKVFSSEASKYIEQRRLKTYQLLGLSIAELEIRSGRELEYTRSIDLDHRDFKDQMSRRSQVAIDSEEFFLEEASDKPYRQLQRICGTLNINTPGVRNIMGTIADYFALYVTHLEATREDLFGIQNNYSVAVAEFPLDKSKVAIIGHLLKNNDSLTVITMSYDSIYPRQTLAPIIIPNS